MSQHKAECFDKKYKQLKQKQKARISDYMYRETDAYFKRNGKMPFTEEECHLVIEGIYRRVVGLGIHISLDEIYQEYRKKRIHIEKRLEENGLPQHITNKIEKAAKPKLKIKKKKKRKKKNVVESYVDQDDTFFFIAGYTSGGAPYGVTWEEMGLELWQELE